MKLANLLHKASSVVAVIGTAVATASHVLTTVPVGLPSWQLGIFVISGVLGAFGFGAQAAKA